MVKFRFEYLYHTTSILTDDNKDALTDGGRIEYNAEMGEFPTSLEDPKFFTITPRCDYHSRHPVKYNGRPYNPMDVFLKYKVLKELDLFNNMGNFEHPTPEQLEGYDGFFGQEDCVEVYLKKPSLFINPQFEIIPFCEKPCTGEDCLLRQFML